MKQYRFYALTFFWIAPPSFCPLCSLNVVSSLLMLSSCLIIFLMKKAVLVVRQVFTHKYVGTAILHLVCSDLTCDYGAITSTCKKRWQVEVFHKSLKSNASLAKTLTHALLTQSNHVFMSICANFKRQCLNIKNQLNPFALCRKLLINASPPFYAQLQQLRAAAA